MEVKALQDILIKMLSAELNETALDCSVQKQLAPNVIPALSALAKRHDLAHIVSASLQKNKLLTDQELASKYSREKFASFYRHEQMQYTYQEICDTFEKEGIPYIPLKGAVLRPYYPKANMRTSCDIDILVREENLDAAILALTKKGFVCGEKDYHDVSLHAPNKVHLELHFHILENMENLDGILQNAWAYAMPEGESYRYAFSKDFFVFHVFAHIAYHFLFGGCGIRSLMDVYVMEHKMGFTYMDAEKLLKKAGILQFAAEFTKLSAVCFAGAPKDDFSDTFLSYIFSGGVYGTPENQIAITKSKANNTFAYMLKRLFLPYDKMVPHFPVLKRLPIFLPFCYVLRFGKMLLGGKAGHTIRELKTANDLSSDKINTMREIRKKLGL